MSDPLFPIARRHLPGVVGLSLLGERSAAATGLILRMYRENGTTRPIAPSTIDDLIAEGAAWLEAEAEAGRDPSMAEMQAAGEYLRGLASVTPKASDVFPAPSPS